MTPTLTEEQLQAIASLPGEPIRLIDPTTNQAYVLLRVEEYERLVPDLALADVYPAIDRAFAEGWNDPKMDDYDRYEEMKR
jgi:hypothetical protein